MITFYTWLKQFHDQDNSLGDLSRDVLDDSGFPRTKKYDIILEYLLSLHASDNALETFEESFSVYQRDISNKKNIGDSRES